LGSNRDRRGEGGEGGGFNYAGVALIVTAFSTLITDRRPHFRHRPGDRPQKAERGAQRRLGKQYARLTEGAVSEHADARAHYGNSKRPPDDPFHRVGKLLLVVRADNKVL
jgi:hypothetical protein